MLDISPRRRIAGRALWVGAALALPLTASISYAVAPPPPPPAPAAPAAPAAPGVPMAPVAPDPDAPSTFIWRSTGNGDKDITVIVRDPRPGEAPSGFERDQNGNPVVRSFTFQHPQPMTPEQRQQIEQARKQWTEQGKQWAEQRKQWAKQHKQWSEQDWDKWGEKLGQQFGEEWAKKWQDSAKEWQEQAQQWQKQWETTGASNFAFAMSGNRVDCDNVVAMPPAPPAPAVQGGLPGRPSVVICGKASNNTARRALERAKASIANDQSLSEETRDEVIESLDRELERLDRDGDTND